MLRKECINFQKYRLEDEEMVIEGVRVVCGPYVEVYHEQQETGGEQTDDIDQSDEESVEYYKNLD